MSGKGMTPKKGYNNKAYRNNYDAVFSKKPQQSLYVVRLYDGFDNIWIDVSKPLPKDEADKLCGDNNEKRLGSGAGKRVGSFNEIDYFAVFPSDTKMVFGG